MPAIKPLQAIGEGQHIIRINDEGSGAEAVIGDLTEPVGDLGVTALIRGGVPPVTYTISEVPVDSTFVPSISDGTIVIAKRQATDTDPTGDYATGTTFTVRATDADGVTATRQVTIRTNRKPEQLHPTQSLWRLRVGTQPEYGPGPEDEAVRFPYSFKAAKNKIFPLQIESASTNTFAHFRDEDHEDLTYAIKEIGTEGSADDATHLMATLDGDRLTIIGVKSTWNPDRVDENGEPDAGHEPVDIVITATDPGGLSADGTIAVTVDGQPQVDLAYHTSYELEASGTAATVIYGLADFFADPEGEAITIVDVTSSGPLIATAAASDDDLQVTPLNPGQVTITFYVQSDPNPHPWDVIFYYVDRDGDGRRDDRETPGTQVLPGSITVTINPS